MLHLLPGGGNLPSPLTHRKDCRLCGDIQINTVLQLTPTPPANAFVKVPGTPQECFPLDLNQCEGCGHLQLSDIVDPNVLFRDYVYVSGTSPSFVRHFERYAAEVAQRCALNAGQLVVELGSNDGTLLKAFMKVVPGVRVLGIDPAVELAKQASHAGVPTWGDFFTAKLAKDIHEGHRGKAKVVCANNVFAHIDDLADVAEGVRELLAPGGLFVFEVQYVVDLFEKGLFDMIYHEHLSYHSVTPLVKFLEAHGLDLFDVQRGPTHGGSIRCFAQLRGGPYTAIGAVSTLVKLEDALRIHDSGVWTGFSSALERHAEDMHQFLHKLTRLDQMVVGFGAPAKATTLMYHFDIGADELDYVVDDNPLKQRLFTPGKHVEVFDPLRLYDDKPDYVVVLAWNFADPIITKHRELMDEEVTFVVPLPTLQLYPPGP